MAEAVKAQGRPWRLRWISAAEIILPIAGAVALTVSGRVDGRIGLLGFEPAADAVLIGIGALLLSGAAILVARRAISLRRLEAEEPTLRRRAGLGEEALLRLMRVELKVLSRKACFFSNERISLYREEGDGFTLVARYAAAPPFDRSLGRECLPADDGVLGQAWARGSAEVGDLPTPGAGDSANRQWLKAQERRCQIPPGIAAGFTMRSQSYVAFRIETFDQEAQGAIVFESTASLPDFGGTAVKPWITEAELEGPVKEASERLAQLLLDSRALSREEIRILLDRQQGPNRAESQAAGS